MKRLNATILENTLDARFADDLSSGRIGGAAACVFQNGICRYERCVGASDPFGTPVTPHTVFRLASMTKPVTAVAVLLLAEHGKLRLDDPIEKYLPAFRDPRLVAPDENGALIDRGAVTTKPTIFHLLTHTSGIGSGVVGAHPSAALPDAAKHDLSVAVSHYASLGLSFEPLTRHEYSPLAAHDLLAHIVEVVSEEDFNDFLHRFVFDRCDMPDTTFVPNDDQWRRLITMHDYRDGQALWTSSAAGCVFEDIPATRYLGGAGLVSTLADYSHFAEMLRARGVWNGRRVLGERWVDMMGAPALPSTLQPGYKRWGLSVRVIVGGGYRSLPIGAYGWSGVYGTHFWVDPANGITAVYMRNSLFDGGFASRLAHRFEQDVTSALTE